MGDRVEVRPPDSEPIRLPDESGIWLRMEPIGVAWVYEVVFDPSAPLRFIARRLAGDVIYEFKALDRDLIGNWWRVP